MLLLCIVDNASLHWLAGWLEGEGSFMRGAPSYPNNARICAVTKDEDTAKRVAELVQRKVYVQAPPTNPKHSQMYRIVIAGKPARELMRILYPLMSARRKEQIESAVSSYVPPTKPSGGALLSYNEADFARELLEEGLPKAEVARRLGVSRHVLRNLETGYRRPNPEEPLAAEH